MENQLDNSVQTEAAEIETPTDIEIYLMKQSPEAIIGWLKGRFDNCTESYVSGNSHFLEVTCKGQLIPVNIVENAAGKAWTSVWFNSPDTPWQFDVDCARDAHQSLKGRVRCNASFWQESVGSSSEWLEINDHGEEHLINWPS